MGVTKRDWFFTQFPPRFFFLFISHWKRMKLFVFCFFHPRSFSRNHRRKFNQCSLAPSHPVNFDNLSNNFISPHLKSRNILIEKRKAQKFYSWVVSETERNTSKAYEKFPSPEIFDNIWSDVEIESGKENSLSANLRCIKMLSQFSSGFMVDPRRELISLHRLISFHIKVPRRQETWSKEHSLYSKIASE